LACVLAIGMFSFYEMMKRDEGQALASVDPRLSAVQDDAGISTYRKRSLRRAVSEDPDNFLDVSGREILSILHDPEMVRTESPTIVWQYRTERCVLDLYFTTPRETALDSPVVHYEIRPRTVGLLENDTQKTECARAFIRANSGMSLLKLQAFYK